MSCWLCAWELFVDDVCCVLCVYAAVVWVVVRSEERGGKRTNEMAWEIRLCRVDMIIPGFLPFPSRMYADMRPVW